jgi:hypothetical protein
MAPLEKSTKEQFTTNIAPFDKLAKETTNACIY